MKAIRYILFPFSLVYGLITAGRNALYNGKIMKATSFDLPIISIGNLTTGGTGKSPHTEYLIKLLGSEFKVATLSRGYGRSVSGFNIVSEESTARECGDEPLQFKRKFPDTVVSVDKDRVNGVIELLKTYPNLDCILLDDAFQHRAIQPGLSILLTEYSQPYYKDWMLPAGDLREWPVGRKRADLIIVTKCPDTLDKQERKAMKKKLRPTSTQKVFFSKFKYGQISALHNGGTAFSSLSDLKDKQILLVTGIAKAEPLVAKMRSEGLNFEHLRFPDHHRFGQKDIRKVQNLFDTFDADKIILTTEKDAQRLRSVSGTEKLPFYFLQIEVAFLDDEQSFKTEIIEHVRNNKVDSGIFEG